MRKLIPIMLCMVMVLMVLGWLPVGSSCRNAKAAESVAPAEPKEAEPSKAPKKPESAGGGAAEVKKSVSIPTRRTVLQSAG